MKGVANDMLSGLSAETLRARLDYDPQTGIFRWRKNGDPAGCVCKTNGYVLIGLDKRTYKAHRLAWLYVHGAWPCGDIDHINRNRSDNRIANLREATRSQNIANSTWEKPNATGLRGVRFVGKKWSARIKKEYREIKLGLFDSPEEAHAAYVAATMQHFGDFTSHSVARNVRREGCTQHLASPPAPSARETESASSIT